MGTRGWYGFRSKGRYFLAYNHWDSYYSGLGVQLLMVLLKLAQASSIPLTDVLREKFSRLKLVFSQGPPPTEEEKLTLKDYALEVSDTRPNVDLSDWNHLLHKTQGRLDLIFESGYFLLDGEDLTGDESIQHNIHIEYVYVFDLDAGELVYYAYEKERGRVSLDESSLLKLKEKWTRDEMETEDE
jgi:hypothetical protein